MKYCLIEDLESDFILPNNYKYVALTQQAIYQLDKKKIKYLTLENFYTSGDIRGDTDKYLYDQLKWFHSLDEVIKQIYPTARKLNINLATVYYYWLKYLVDNIILTSKILTIFILKTNPNKIIFVSSNYQAEKLEPLLQFKDSESTYSRLIYPICEKYNIPLERIIIKRRLKNTPKIDNIKQLIKLLPKVYNVYKGAREFLTIIKYLPLYMTSNNHNKLNIVFLKQTNITFHIFKEIKKYINCYVFTTKCVYKSILSFSNKKILLYKTSNEVQKIDSDVSLVNIYLWINEKCGVDVTTVLKSRIDYYLYLICNEIISMIPFYVEYYSKNNIDYIITDSVSTFCDYAALTATKICSNTKAVYFSHGCDAFEARSRYLYLYHAFDYCFLPTIYEVQNEIKNRNKFNSEYPKMLYSSYFASLNKYRIRRKIKNNRKQVVLFMPIMAINAPSRPIDKVQPFPMEYVEWHKELYKLFIERLDCIFIWKGFFMQNQQFDLMKSVIEDSSNDNIKYHSNDYVDWLSKIDKVICDIPSTAFFMALFSGLPVMSLYRPNDQILHDNAANKYHSILKPYSNVSEGLTHVEKFLDDVSEQDSAHIPVPEKSISDVLLSGKDQ